ncbi:MAG TPA: Fur family transcriptional regulator [Anaerolineales bacterium]|nr:Fur family transcriptional regulator [Anaerolineales bacterium]
MPVTFASTLDMLADRGYRLTRPRQAVLRALFEDDDWLRPEEVLTHAREHFPSVGLVTVYRTLGLLEELGVVRRIHVEPGCHGYALAGLGHGHYLTCRSCHRVLEFPGREDLSPLIRQISRHTGFVVEDHLLELSGTCATCRRRRRSAPRRRREP